MAVSSGAITAGPPDAVASVLATCGPAALGVASGGGPLACGRAPLQNVVLAASHAHTRLGLLGQGEALLPRCPASHGKEGYPWQDLCGPLPELPAVPAMRLRLGVPSGWIWELSRPFFATRADMVLQEVWTSCARRHAYDRVELRAY